MRQAWLRLSRRTLLNLAMGVSLGCLVGCGSSRSNPQPTLDPLKAPPPVGTTSQIPLPSGDSGPEQIVRGLDGNMWFTLRSAGKIGKISPTGSVSTFSIPEPSGGVPEGIAAGSDGQIWFTLRSAGKIGKISPTGSVSTFLVPEGINSEPSGITLGPDGDLWFTLRSAGKIGKISPTGSVSTFMVPGGGDPGSICAGPDGNLWFGMRSAGKIGKISPTGSVSTFQVPPGLDPTEMATGADGNIWCTLRSAGKIGKISPTGSVSTYALPQGLGDPNGITSGPNGTVWFTLRSAGKIGKISPTGNALAPVLSADDPSFSLFDLPSANSQPTGIAFGPDGKFYITQPGNNSIGTLQGLSGAAEVSVSVSPSSVSVMGGGRASFTATVLGTENLGVTWTAPEGQITASGIYTAPSKTGTYRVRATSNRDSAKFAEASVTVLPMKISIAPEKANVAQGETLEFSAFVENASNGAVTWSAQRGQITSEGVYTAPASLGKDVVRVTSLIDPSVFAEAQIDVVTPIGVTVDPASATVDVSGSQQFKATVTGTSQTGVTWSVIPTTLGTIDASGRFTAGADAGEGFVRASSVVDPRKYAQANINVIKPITVTINPAVAQLNTGSSLMFQAIVGNSSDTRVRWSATDGVINNGYYTAPYRSGVFIVRAESVADSKRYAEAKVTVTSSIRVEIDPAEITLVSGGKQQFSSKVTGGNSSAVTWTASKGVINADGLYTAHTPSSADENVLVRATSVEDKSKFAESKVIVKVISISLDSPGKELVKSSTYQFKPIVTNAADPSVTWMVARGSISATGLYTAPSTLGRDVVRVASVQDPSKFALTEFDIIDGQIVTVSPTSVTLARGGTQRFSASLGAQINGGNKNLIALRQAFNSFLWSVVESNGGSITSEGVYTAPSVDGIYHVKATYPGDGSYGIATVTVSGTGNQPPSAPVVTGPANGIQWHTIQFNLSSVDPDRDSIVFIVSKINSDQIITTDATQDPQTGNYLVTGALWKWAPWDMGIHQFDVVAKDSFGNLSTPTRFSVSISLNNPVVFSAWNPGVIVVPGGTALGTLFPLPLVSAVDPEGDTVSLERDLDYVITIDGSPVGNNWMEFTANGSTINPSFKWLTILTSGMHTVSFQVLGSDVVNSGFKTGHVCNTESRVFTFQIQVQ